MANRQHFSRAVKFEIAKRATRPDGQLACEKCGAVGVRLELHHLDMDAMKTSEAKRARKLTAANGAMWCVPCHKPESASQRRVLARVEAAQERHLGVRRERPAIPSRGFAKAERAPRRLDPDKLASGLTAIARQFQKDKT